MDTEAVKIKDLTVGELKYLISDTVKEAVEDLIEDVSAISSEAYLKSIEEARKDYKEGKVKYLEEVLDVYIGLFSLRGH
jgi:hypothetical protein